MSFCISCIVSCIKFIARLQENASKARYDLAIRQQGRHQESKRRPPFLQTLMNFYGVAQNTRRYKKFLIYLMYFTLFTYFNFVLIYRNIKSDYFKRRIHKITKTSTVHDSIMTHTRFAKLESIFLLRPLFRHRSSALWTRNDRVEWMGIPNENPKPQQFVSFRSYVAI